jgi:SecA-like ATPase subunit of protein translocation complex
MGLFSWLFGKPSRVTTHDIIWLTDAARGDGVAQRVGKDLAAERSVLLVAQFPATLEAFGEHIIAREWQHVAAPSDFAPEAALTLAAAGAPRVIYALARNLRAAVPAPPEDSPASPLSVIVLERHILREHDNRVVEFAEGLGGKAEVTYHTSLDDPLMKLFAGDWVREMLRRLGIHEDEPITSALISRRMQAARARVAQRIASDHDADSAEEWIERNWAG